MAQHAESERRHREEVDVLKQSIAVMQAHTPTSRHASASSSQASTSSSRVSSSASPPLATMDGVMKVENLRALKNELSRLTSPARDESGVQARRYTVTQPSSCSYDTNDELDDGEEAHYIRVDDEEKKVREKERLHQQHERTIYESEEADESVLQSYIKWLEQREKSYPFADNRHNGHYRKRHSLLNAAGRRMEWIRFAFRCEFDVTLYGGVMNRWYRRFMQEYGGQRYARRVRAVSDNVLVMPVWSYDTRDIRFNNKYDDTVDDTPSNSHALSSLPHELRYTPSSDELAPSFTSTTSEYGRMLIKQQQRRRRASARRRAHHTSAPPFSDSSSSSSSDDDLEHFECTKCGELVKDRPMSRYCARCEAAATNLRHLRAAIKREKSDEPPPLETVYDHEAEVKKAMTASVKKENEERRAAKTGITADDAGELGSVMMEVFTEAGRAAVKLSRGSVEKYTVSETTRAIDSAARQCGLFDGDVKKAPMWLRTLCTQIYTHRFKQPECIRLLMQLFSKEARAWFDASFAEVSLLANDSFTHMRVVETLLLRFKKQYMGPTQIRMYRDQIRSTRLTGANNARDLKQHYATFVNVANNLRACDKSVTEADIKEWYWEALPYNITQYIGPSYREVSTVDKLFQMAEECVTKNSAKQDTRIDGEMRARLHAMTIDDYNVQYDDVYAYDHDDNDTTHINAYGTRDNRRQSDASNRWRMRNMANALCYHCGKRGHMTGNCMLIDQPQTVQGKAAWALRNTARGKDYVYDKQYYIDNKITVPSSSSSSSSSSTSTPSSVSNNYPRGRNSKRQGDDHTTSSTGQSSSLQQRLRDAARGNHRNRGGRGGGSSSALAAPAAASTVTDTVDLRNESDTNEGSD